MTNQASTPSEAINSYMQEKGWTQQELADHLDVSRQTANYLVNGRSELTGKMMLRLSKLTGQPVEYWHRLQNNSQQAGSEGGERPIANSFYRQAPGLLVDEEIIAALQSEDLIIQDFDPELLSSLHYTLRVGENVIEANGSIQNQGTAELNGGSIYTIESLEHLTLPDQICAQLDLISDFGELGFQIMGSRTLEPGHDGKVALSIASMLSQDKHIATGDPIFRVSFEWLAQVPAQVRRRRELHEINEKMSELDARKKELLHKQDEPLPNPRKKESN